MSSDKNKTFPNATVTLITTGRPDPLTLSILQGELYVSPFLYGQLALIMPATKYATMEGAIDYIAPPHPGVQADASAAATAVMITQLNHQHDKALEHHMLYANVSNALKQQLLEVVNDMFVSVLRHQQRLRYSQAPPPHQLLKHLINTYNIVTQETLKDNRNRLGAKWNPNKGMDLSCTLWSWIST